MDFQEASKQEIESGKSAEYSRALNPTESTTHEPDPRNKDENSSLGPISNTQLKRDPIKAMEAKPHQGQYNAHERYNGIGGDLIHSHKVPWTSEKEKILFGPFDYMFGNPGKDIRSQLVAAFNAWLKVPERSLGIITRVVGMLHTASLL